MDQNGLRGADTRLMRFSPVVGDVDDSLVTFVTDKLHLILGCQDCLGLVLLAGLVPNTDLNGAWVSFFTVDAAVLEEQGVAAMALDRVRAIKDSLSPTILTAVQGIGAVILRETIFTTVQALNNGILDTVGDATDRGTEVRGVVLDIVALRGEAQNDVLATDAELLDDGTERQEGKLGLFGGGHDGRGEWD